MEQLHVPAPCIRAQRKRLDLQALFGEPARPRFVAALLPLLTHAVEDPQEASAQPLARLDRPRGVGLVRHEAAAVEREHALDQLFDLRRLGGALEIGGEQVSESRVTDALWPRIDGDSAHRSFTSTLHRLRKLLGEDRAITLHEGRVSLDRRYFWLDTWAFEQLAADLESINDSQQMEKVAERLLALYRGSFMADDADAAWLLQARERLRGRFARVLARVCRHWEERGEAAKARLLQEKTLEIDPLAARPAEIKPSVTDR